MVAPITAGIVAEVRVHIAGDIGGQGISRFRFTRSDPTTPPTVTDCNAAGAAVRGLYNAINLWPSNISIAFDPIVETFDIGSGLVQGSQAMSTIPGTITGTQASAYGAGLGMRINWKSNSTFGRRLVRGATFMVPVSSGAFSSTGAVGSALVTSVSLAAQNYLLAMTTAILLAGTWHRPLKHTTTGGVFAPSVTGSVSSVPAGLRSRRH